MPTTFVCLENPYEVCIFTLCWSTFQIVELASSLWSIKLPLSDHLLRSLGAAKFILTQSSIKPYHKVCNLLNQAKALKRPFL